MDVSELIQKIQSQSATVSVNNNQIRFCGNIIAPFPSELSLETKLEILLAISHSPIGISIAGTTLKVYPLSSGDPKKIVLTWGNGVFAEVAAADLFKALKLR